MKRQTSIWHNLILLSIILMFLSSCQFNQLFKFPAVAEVMILEREGESFGDYAVSPDGLYYYSSFGGKTNIQTGEVTLVDNYVCTRNGPIRLSPDARYLSGNNNATGMGIYDIQEGKCYQPQNPRDTYPVESWSPESNRFIQAHSKIIMDFPAFMEVQYPIGYPLDFRKVKNIYGNGQTLWDKDSNLPIAETVTSCEGCTLWDDPSFPNLQAKKFLEIRSLDIPSLSESTTPIREKLLIFDWITGIYYPIFDPTGEYILVAVEERTLPPTPTQELSPQQKYDYYYDSKYVKDTVLMLVHWRTKEHIELLRLSQYGQVQSHAILSDMSWSADGSTIFVPRTNAPPLVLKIKYP